MYRILLLLFVLAGASTPARADITATYQHPRMPVRITIHAGDNGDARVQFSNQIWRMQIVGGEGYGIYPQPSGTTRVIRLSDMEQLFAERRPSIPIPPGMDQSSLVRRGEATVGGHRGTAYFLSSPALGGLSPFPILVVSSDPTLAPLGRSLVRQLDFSIAAYTLAGIQVPAIYLNIRRSIGDGAPLTFMGLELQAVDRSPVDPALLRLPAPAVTMEELRRDGVPNIS